MTVQTENFNLVSDPKLLCACGHPECDKRSVSQIHLERVQYVRELVGHPLVVTSGGRFPYHQDEIHRTKPADHQNQRGVDVAVTGATVNVADAELIPNN